MWQHSMVQECAQCARLLAKQFPEDACANMERLLGSDALKVHAVMVLMDAFDSSSESTMLNREVACSDLTSNVEIRCTSAQSCKKRCWLALTIYRTLKMRMMFWSW